MFIFFHALDTKSSLTYIAINCIIKVAIFAERCKYSFDWKLLEMSHLHTRHPTIS